MRDVTIRMTTIDEAAEAVAVRRAVYPYLISTADSLRRSYLEAPAERRAASWVAVVDGEVVAMANCALNTWTSEEGRVGASVQVLPEHRRSGIGTAMYEEIHAHAAATGGRRIQTFAQQDFAGFAERLGFEPNRELRYVAVDLDALPPQPATPPGMTVAPFADLDPRRVFEADQEASKDEPSDSPLDAVGYDDWYRDTWDDPLISLDLSVAAVTADGRVVAYTLVEADGERAWSAMSGTVRDHRGQGLSKLVKSVALRRCAAAGITLAATSMDERNGPMLAVNGWLGYRRIATHVGLSRPV